MPRKKSAPPKSSSPASPADGAVDMANKASDVLDAKFRSFSCPNFTVRLEVFTVTSLSKELQNWVFDLCKANMEAMYKKVWGWNNNKKRRQFAAPTSRFCVAFLDREGQQPEAVGYVNYRYEKEEADAVLYCYELQLAPAVRGRGLGPHLMTVLEALATSAHMHRVMLTVMSENTHALAMYRKLGYVLDDSSPGFENALDDSGYRIMSKEMVPAQHGDKPGPQPAGLAGALAQQERDLDAVKGGNDMVGAKATVGRVLAADVQQQQDTLV